MKWILWFIVVTSNGVTESQSNFASEELCAEAATEVHLKYDSVAKSVVTKCSHVDGEEVEVWHAEP